MSDKYKVYFNDDYKLIFVVLLEQYPEELVIREIITDLRNPHRPLEPKEYIEIVFDRTIILEYNDKDRFGSRRITETDKHYNLDYNDYRQLSDDIFITNKELMYKYMDTRSHQIYIRYLYKAYGLRNGDFITVTFKDIKSGLKGDTVHFKDLYKLENYTGMYKGRGYILKIENCILSVKDMLWSISFAKNLDLGIPQFIDWVKLCYEFSAWHGTDYIDSGIAISKAGIELVKNKE